MRATALHDRLLAGGAQVRERAGFAVAAGFGDLAAEYAAAREHVAIADRGARGFTRLEGPDAARFLQGMVTNDIEGIAVDDARYALLLTPKARIVTDLRLLRLAADAFLADCEAEAADAMRALLTRYRLAAKVQIAPADDEIGALAVVGPDARALLEQVLGAAPAPAAAEGAGTSFAVGGERVHALVSLACGPGTIELIGSRAAIAASFDRLAERLDAFGGRTIGEDACELLRIESGIPRYGAELDAEVMPAEAGVVERAVSFTKGCYPGQEPVARLHHRGHANRRLCALLVAGPAPARGAAVRVADRDVGRVTSAAAPAGGHAHALAIVRREVGEGTQVRIAWDGAEVAAEVRPLPAGARES